MYLDFGLGAGEGQFNQFNQIGPARSHQSMLMSSEAYMRKTMTNHARLGPASRMPHGPHGLLDFDALPRHGGVGWAKPG